MRYSLHSVPGANFALVDIELSLESMGLTETMLSNELGRG